VNGNNFKEMAISKSLKVAAQAIMDSYYQDFKPDDDFFDLEDFAIWIGKVYGSVADQVAKQIYDASRSETGMGLLVFSQDWWAKKTVSIKENEADITDLKFTGFTYDTQTSGIQQLGNGKTFIRTTLTQLWELERRSKSSIIYWYTDFDKIKFDATCDLPKEVDVYYIPTPEDSQFKLPKSKDFEIATMAWNFMIAAKKETPFVDATNNSNTNVTPQTEVDLAQTQPIK